MNKEERVALVVILFTIAIVTAIMTIFTLTYTGVFDITPVEQEEEIITAESCLVDKQTRFDQLTCMDNRIQELEERLEYLESLPRPE